ncbi:MAG: hypothetical protein V4850_33075 [Myxococcota bacterium]
MAQAIDQQAVSFPFWERLLIIAPQYTEVAHRLSRLGIPEEFAAVPLGLSGYRDAALGPDCRTGPWLLGPTDQGIRVADCQLRASGEFWSPPAEPEGGLTFDGVCRIARCGTDERTSFARSTDAALTTIERRWRAAPEAPGKLPAQLAEAAGMDPALVLAWHALAVCFYGSAEEGWGARWRPRPAWCGDALPFEFAEVARCSALPPPTP